MKRVELNIKKPVKQNTETTSLENEVRQELNEYQEAFKNQMKKESENIDRLTDTGFWFCAYFADKEQCQEFLKNSGLSSKMEAQYINGEMMADIFKIKITKKKIKVPPSFKKHKNLNRLIRE